jgi:hypothetical protein
MRWMKGRRPSPAMVVSVAALVVGMGGSALAVGGAEKQQKAGSGTDWAVISANEGVIKQSGGIALFGGDAPDSGNWHLAFPGSLKNRPMLVSVHGGGGSIGMASVTACGSLASGGAPCSNPNADAYVRTVNTAGNPADLKFTVVALPK